MAGTSGVVQNSDGTWSALVNGQSVGGGPFATADQATTAYDANAGPATTTTSTPANTAATSTNGTTSSSNGNNSNYEGYNPSAWAQVEAQVQQAYNEGMLKYNNERLALDAAVAAADQGMKALGLMAQLQGPRNAFQEQDVLHGLNSQGYGKAIDALAGKYSVPTYGAPNAPAQGVTLGTMAQDAQQAGTGGLPAYQNPVDQALGNIFSGLGWSAPYGTPSTSSSTSSTTSSSTPTTPTTPSSTGSTSTGSTSTNNANTVTIPQTTFQPAPTSNPSAPIPSAQVAAPSFAAPTYSAPTVNPYSYSTGVYPTTPQGSSQNYNGVNSYGIPVYDTGGTVQGQPGGHVLALLESGERVLPPPGTNPAFQAQQARQLSQRYQLPVYDTGGTVPSYYDTKPTTPSPQYYQTGGSSSGSSSSGGSSAGAASGTSNGQTTQMPSLVPPGQPPPPPAPVTPPKTNWNTPSTSGQTFQSGVSNPALTQAAQAALSGSGATSSSGTVPAPLPSGDVGYPGVTPSATTPPPSPPPSSVPPGAATISTSMGSVPVGALNGYGNQVNQNLGYANSNGSLPTVAPSVPTPPAGTTVTPFMPVSGGGAGNDATSNGGIPVYDTGGRVVGRPGGHTLALLETGERVIRPPHTNLAAQQAQAQRLSAALRLPVYDAGGVIPPANDYYPPESNTIAPSVNPNAPTESTPGAIPSDSSSTKNSPPLPGTPGYTPPGWTPPPSPSGISTGTFMGVPNSQDPNQWLKYFPQNPTQANWKFYNSADPDTKAFIESGYSKLGWSPDYIKWLAGQSMPQFRAPVYATIQGG